MIHVELATPERLAFSDDVDFIAAPTPQGEIGILPRHAPLLTQLSYGILRLKKGNNSQYIAVTGGFLEVKEGSRVYIFAETAEFSDQIDVERARLAAERAKAKLKEPQADMTGEELAKVEAALSRAVLRIKIGEKQWRKQKPEGVR
ncbi:MAG: ATP synthase epsilon chain [Elusimicrobia bacterium]|nr:ATP synthase epsilon chain [Elusimicrobiota bacterium]